MMESLQTARLLLRGWRLDDAEALLDIMSRVEVVKWLGDDGPKIIVDLAQARRVVVRYQELSTKAPLGFWAVEDRAQRVVGWALLATLGETAEVELAYALHPDVWGHGYAVEAAGAVIDYGLHSGVPRIWGITHPGNDRSMGVLARCGLTYLGARPNEWYAGMWETYCVEAAAGEQTPQPLG